MGHGRMSNGSKSHAGAGMALAGRAGPAPQAGRRSRAGALVAGLRGRLALLAAALLLAAPLAAPQAAAAELKLVEIGAPGATPAAGYPTPSDPGMVFYLQRSANPNTVVYAVRLSQDGGLDASQPISAFWRRYNAQGQVQDLSMLERRLAYGVTAKPRGDGRYDVRFRAVPRLDFVLEPGRQGDAVLTFAPQGEPIEVSHGFVELDESGLVPEVTELRVYGKRRGDGQPVEVVYGVSGGTVPG